MPGTGSTSSSPAVEDRLIRVPLERLYPHPRNANLMSAERLEKLARNITVEGRYPPLIVRPHPEIDGSYQILDGHQREAVLADLGHADALCFLWPCDDATALVLLATLNRLEGEDVPARRAELLAELSALLPPEALAQLLPEDARAIEETLSLLDLDSERLLAELTAAAARSAATAPRLVSFAVLPEDEPLIERAIAAAAATLSGPNRRGRALATVCRAFLEEDEDG
jgi:ParB-like chromosome segregation protein Spo0J